MTFNVVKKAGFIATLLVGAAFAASAPASADFQISIFNGYAYNHDTDFTVKQGADNFTLNDVESDSKSFTFDGGPPYYGARLTYWLPSRPNWGIALDYVHAKVAPDLDQVVEFSGTETATQAINEEVDDLEFTDGLNLLTLNALYRFNPHNRFVPYVGAGVGLSIPHVEFSRTGDDTRTFDYQIAGVAAQVLAGLELKWSDRWSSFAEYRFAYAGVDGDLDGGGSLETDIYQHHISVGLSYRFGSMGGHYK